MTAIFWYHVDATHGSFNTMKSDAAIEHAKGSPNTELSIFMNVAGTEALVKVVAESDAYSPGWENAPFVTKRYTEADHSDLFVDLDFYSAAWNPPVIEN